MSEPAILVRRSDGVAWVTVNRPDVHNAVDRAAMDLLGDRLDALAADDSVRCMVLTGAGRAFCAGADLGAGTVAHGEDGDEAEAGRMLAAAGRVVRLLTGAPVSVVAAANGPAAGVGASLAFAADLVLAARQAYFLLPFTGIGLLPDGGSTLTLAASVGRARAMRLALRRERFGAEAAYEAGLVSALCESGELETLAAEWAADLVSGPRVAIARTKAAINAATIGDLNRALDLEAVEQVALLGAADFREGAAAFRERRPPAFGD